MIDIETVELPTGKFEAVWIVEPADLVEVRDSDWSDGQVQLLTFRSAEPVAYVGVTPPLALTGRVAAVGCVLVKGPAGDIEVWPSGAWAQLLDEVRV